MVVTVTPNVAVDITYTIEDFAIDRIHRPSETRRTAGGKGINVVRVLNTLGSPGLATGFVGGRTGESILEMIVQEGLDHEFVNVAGESRLCIAVVDPRSGTQTKINENGPHISPEEISRLMERVREMIRDSEYIALCGMCPPGVPAGFYGDIIKMAGEAGVKSVLDTSGQHLLESLKYGPYMVKPNLTELSQIAGREIMTIEETVSTAKSLKRFGVEIIAVTMGRSGAIVTDGSEAWLAVPPEIKFVSAVGSGDAFLAGFLHALMDGSALPDALSMGTAAGAANATTFDAGLCSKDSIMEIRQGVVLTKL